MEKRLNIHELAEILGVSVNTIYSWISQRKIPYIKVGRLVRFDRNKINEWLETHSVPVYSDKEKSLARG
ncbi:MAG: helix-turn-helix domain-containing protein [Candidatus Omnitrophota bacterium]